MLPSGLAQFRLCVLEVRNCGPRESGMRRLQTSGLAQSLGLVGNPADACAFLGSRWFAMGLCMSACPAEDTWALGQAHICLHLPPAIPEGDASPGKQAGDLAECPVDSSERNQVSFTVLLGVITKLSHVGSTGLSRLNQGWAGPCFLGEAFSDRPIGSRDSQAGGLCTQSSAVGS